MKPTTVLCAVTCLVVCGCQHTPSKNDLPFNPTGEVFSTIGSARFDSDRVIGPNINLEKRADGSWAGRLYENFLDLNEYENRVGGVDLTMQRLPLEKGEAYAGQWQGQFFRIDLGEKGIQVRTATRSFSLPKRARGQYGQGQLTLTGQAADDAPPFPQFAFALLGSFLKAGKTVDNGRVGGYQMIIRHGHESSVSDEPGANTVTPYGAQ